MRILEEAKKLTLVHGLVSGWRWADSNYLMTNIPWTHLHPSDWVMTSVKCRRPVKRVNSELNQVTLTETMWIIARPSHPTIQANWDGGGCLLLPASPDLVFSKWAGIATLEGLRFLDAIEGEVGEVSIELLFWKYVLDCIFKHPIAFSCIVWHGQIL